MSVFDDPRAFDDVGSDLNDGFPLMTAGEAFPAVGMLEKIRHTAH